MKNYNYIIGNRTRDLPNCRAVPQPTAPPRAPLSPTCVQRKLTVRDLYDLKIKVLNATKHRLTNWPAGDANGSLGLTMNSSHLMVLEGSATLFVLTNVHTHIYIIIIHYMY